MTSEQAGQKAVDYYLAGCNCAQALVLTWQDQLGLSREQAMKLSSSFGGGMGRLREVCGALTGAFMVAGLLRGYDQTDDDQTKEQHYSLIQEIARRFEDKYGTLLCRDLLELDLKHDSPAPAPRTAAYYDQRPCASFINDAAAILAELLAETEKAD